MNLKELATLALDEEIVEDAVKKHSQKKDAESSDSPVATTENPDGTITLSMVISFDPKIREEKAKAMAKGVKRDDLADDIPDETPEPAEDSAPRGVFAAALDELAAIAPEIAEDASPRRQHGLSPIENCRAKDPMFCPYHGQAAIKNAVDQELQKLGMTGYNIEVRPHDKDFMLDVVLPSSGLGWPLRAISDAIVQAFSSKSGINLVKPPDFYNGYANGVRLAQTRLGDIESIIVSPSAANRSEQDVSKLDEWIDDLVTDIADDPTLMQDLDPQDLRDLLEARETLDKSAGTPQGDAAYDACREKYHYVRAQADYRDIKTQGDALNAEAAVTNDVENLSKDYHAAKDLVDNAKKALFKGGRFPNGFAKAHPWAEKYNKLSTAVGYFAQKRWDDALDANLKVPGNDIKARRASLSAMDYAKETYEKALAEYQKGLPEFMEDFEDWAMNDPSIQPAQFKAAFPNSSSKAATPAPQPAQQPPATPAQQPASPAPASAPATPAIESVEDRFKKMTDAKAQTILAKHFGKVCSSKSDLSSLLQRSLKRRARDVASQKAVKENSKYLAAAMDYLDERFPNAKFPKPDFFLPSRHGSNYGSAFRARVMQYNVPWESCLVWTRRTAKEQQRDDAQTANGNPGYTVSNNPPPDTRDQTTIFHEMAHFLNHNGTTANEWAAAKNAAGPTASWIGKVSDYAKKNDRELHSEVVSQVMRPDYKKGTLPQSLEKYVFEDVLGVPAGQW